MTKRHARIRLLFTVTTPDPTPGGGNPTPTPDPAQPPAPKTDPAPTPPAPAPAVPPAPGSNLPDDPEALKQIIQQLRSENAKSRTTAKDQAAQAARDEVIKEVGKKLGLIKDDEPVDSVKLGEQLTASQAANRANEVKLAVFQNAPDGVNVKALMDSVAFNRKIEGLDPSAENFSSQVLEAINAAVTANPQFRTGRAPVKGGNELPGGPGGAEQITEAELASMTPAQIAEALEKGLLKNLLG